LEILKRTPKRYQDLVLWAWLEFCSPLRGTNSTTTHYLLSIFYQLVTLKGRAKAPAVDLLRLNTLRGRKNSFLTPERYNEHPHHFLYESPPTPHP